jgi:hypothetical protein
MEELYRFRQYLTEESSVNEGILQDLGNKVKPALSKIFSTGKSKSKQVYDIVKKEIKDPENAQKALEVVSKAYNGIKNVADKTTSNPDDLKAISKFMPGLKTASIGTAVASVYQLVSGFDIVSNGWFSSPKIVWGDPSTALMVGGILVSLKLIMYALQAIAGVRKATSAIKAIFKENEEVMTGVDFSDIEGIFELKLQ